MVIEDQIFIIFDVFKFVLGGFCVDCIMFVCFVVDDFVVGKMIIVDGVVVKVVGIVVCEVFGVYVFGGGGVCVFGVICSVVNVDDKFQGVKVEVGEIQVVVDIIIVVEYLMLVQEVVFNVCVVVSGVISQLVGFEVVEVNVEVNDVYLFLDDKDEEELCVL